MAVLWKRRSFLKPCAISRTRLEGKLAEEQIAAILVAANLTERHSSGPVAVS